MAAGTHTTSPLRGAEAIDALLEERTFDVRRVADVRGFRAWLERHRPAWERDELFRQRLLIRDIKRAHPELARREREYRAAARAVEGSDAGERLERLERECSNTRKAIAGLSRALAAEVEKRAEALRDKLARFEERLDDLARERRSLLAGCGECREARAAARRLERARAETGLAAAERALTELQTMRGRHSTSGGTGFEEEARSVVEEWIVPELAAEGSARILTGVTLGAARVELDIVVIDATRDPTLPARVLAVVEAKRNINDLAHGLRLRRENLAWLRGADAGYDPPLYRTRALPEGRFDRPVRHRDGELELLFDRSSFARLGARDDAGLYLLTRPGPVWGLSSAALARLAWRIATDPRLDDSDASIERLLGLAHSLADREETPDVVRQWRRPPLRAQRFLLLHSKKIIP